LGGIVVVVDVVDAVVEVVDGGAVDDDTSGLSSLESSSISSL